MRSAEELRTLIRGAAARRREADRQREQANERLKRYLRQVSETKGITMTEAAEIVGVSRVQLYRMLAD